MEVHSKKYGKGHNPHDPASELTRIQEYYYYYGNGFLLAAKTIDKPENMVMVLIMVTVVAVQAKVGVISTP
jgi:hypothetical protein